MGTSSDGMEKSELAEASTTLRFSTGDNSPRVRELGGQDSFRFQLTSRVFAIAKTRKSASGVKMEIGMTNRFGGTESRKASSSPHPSARAQQPPGAGHGEPGAFLTRHLSEAQTANAAQVTQTCVALNGFGTGCSGVHYRAI